MLTLPTLVVLTLALQSTAANGAAEEGAKSARATAAETWLASNVAYDEGRYRDAIDGYSRLLAAGNDHSALYYNLGNALLKDGELGRAIAAYLRAQRRQPRNPDISANLDHARQSARDDLTPPAPRPLLEAVLFWHYRLSRGESWFVLIIANFLFWGLLSRRLFSRRSAILPAAIVSSALIILATGSSLAVRMLAPTRLAVIVPQEVAVHAGTNEATLVRFKLHAGSEVSVLEEQPDWIRVSLPDGQQGWLQSRNAELLRQ